MICLWHNQTMEKPRVSAIAAIGQNRELGKDNQLIWKLEADFERMKDLVRGHPLIMGRATYESIGRELPYSPCIVITSQEDYRSPYPNPKHTHIVHTLAAAFRKAIEIENERDDDDKEVFIFGGAKVYAEALPQTERLYLTEVAATDPEADTFFPEYDDFATELEKTEHEEDGVTFRLLTLERAG